LNGEKLKSGIVLQARLDSSRLPNKALLPLGGKPLILRVMEALNRVPADVRVLACPEDSRAAFEFLAGEAGFELFAGPKDDVLKRYCLAVREFGIDHVVRATGDNPFVFADAAAEISCQAFTLGADYAGYSSLPLGGGVEAVLVKALLQAENDSSTPHDREHVCPYLYANPQLFRLHRPLAPIKWQGSEIRLTVDTEEDYNQAKRLYDALDMMEKQGEIAEGDRYKGEIIIDTFLTMFRNAQARKQKTWKPV